MLIFALVKEVELPLTCYFYLFIKDRSFTNIGKLNQCKNLRSNLKNTKKTANTYFNLGII